MKEKREVLMEVMNEWREKGKGIERGERGVGDCDGSMRKKEEGIFKGIEANERGEVKGMEDIVWLVDGKGKRGVVDDIKKVYEREKERRGV